MDGYFKPKEALFYEHLEKNSVLCRVCRRQCRIPDGEYGYCHTRYNKGGILYTLAYGRVSSSSIAPAEIKPLFHFFPGSTWLSLGTLGCNFFCPGCQNWEIAYARISVFDEKIQPPNTSYLSPEGAVATAGRNGCLGLSFTYNEPTVWLEYTLDCARLAKEAGLMTNYVTNGYMSEEALDAIGPFLNAFRTDLKCFSSNCYKQTAHITGFSGILENIERAKFRWGMHIEIVTNVTPGFNDDENQLSELSEWIVDVLGRDVPWHVTRFVPRHMLNHLPCTPVQSLETARAIGTHNGLRYVYIGNVPGHAAQNTFCPECGSLLIERENYTVLRYRIEKGKCPECGCTIAGRWENSQC